MSLCNLWETRTICKGGLQKTHVHLEKIASWYSYCRCKVVSLCAQSLCNLWERQTISHLVSQFFVSPITLSSDWNGLNFFPFWDCADFWLSSILMRVGQHLSKHMRLKKRYYWECVNKHSENMGTEKECDENLMRPHWAHAELPVTTCNFFSQNCLFVTILGLREEREKILREHSHTMLNLFATSEKHKQPEIGCIALNLLHPLRKSLRKT